MHIPNSQPLNLRFNPSTRNYIVNQQSSAYPQPIEPLRAERVPTLSNPLSWDISTQQPKIISVHLNLSRELNSNTNIE
jgi:hypothetical protein